MPVQVIKADLTALTGIKKISVNNNTSLALDHNATLWSWGDNYQFKLGRLGSSDTSVAGQVLASSGVPLSDVMDMSTGGSHSVALKRDGTVWSWGDDGYEQLGDGSSSWMDPSYELYAVQVLNNDGYPLDKIQSVATGSSFSLALADDGSVWAWGDNYFGQLGDGSDTSSVFAQPVPGLSNVVQIAVSDQTAYALLSDGTVKAWGNNELGMLGDATVVANSTLPVTVLDNTGLPLSNISYLAAGYQSAAAIDANGVFWTWGRNDMNQLGLTLSEHQYQAQVSQMYAGIFAYGDSYATDEDNSVVMDILANDTTDTGGSLTVTSISKAAYGILTLQGDGTVLYEPFDNYHGNDNFSYTVSDGTYSTIAMVDITLYPVEDAPTVRDDAIHTLPSTSTDLMVLMNDFDAEGDELTITALDTSMLSAGSTASISADGKYIVYTASGFLHSDTLNYTVSDQNESIHGITAQGVAIIELPDTVAVTGNHSTVIMSDGAVKSWGYNTYGHLGNNSNTDSPTPVFALHSDLSPLDNVVDLDASMFGLALKVDGTVWSWGDNWYGQLGNGSNTDTNTAAQVQVDASTMLSDMVAVSAGNRHSLVLRRDGTVWAWGQNNSGELARGTSNVQEVVPMPVLISSGVPLTDVMAISAGTSFSLALRKDGTVWSWGNNTEGALGVGDKSSRYWATQLFEENGRPLTRFISIDAGYMQSAAVRADGTVWAWGKNYSGELGNGDASTTTPVSSLYPIQSNISGAMDVAIGSSNMAVLKSDGTVWMVGGNDVGEMANGSIDTIITTRNYVATQAQKDATTYVDSVIGLDLDSSHIITRMTDGTIWLWGANGMSQLGDGTTTSSPYAVQASGL